MKILKIAVFAVIIAATVVFGYSSYQKNQKPELSELAIANIEALTQSGETSGSGTTNPDCQMEVTTDKKDSKGQLIGRYIEYSCNPKVTQGYCVVGYFLYLNGEIKRSHTSNYCM